MSRVLPKRSSPASLADSAALCFGWAIGLSLSCRRRPPLKQISPSRLYRRRSATDLRDTPGTPKVPPRDDKAREDQTDFAIARSGSAARLTGPSFRTARVGYADSVTPYASERSARNISTGRMQIAREAIRRHGLAQLACGSTRGCALACRDR
jgi:hypothetical protein